MMRRGRRPRCEALWCLYLADQTQRVLFDLQWRQNTPLTHISTYSSYPFSRVLSHQIFYFYRLSTLLSRPLARSSQQASSHLSPGHFCSPPSRLHSTLLRTYLIPARHVTFPHASCPAASPRRVSHSRKPQSHSLQAFSEVSAQWRCFAPSVSTCREEGERYFDWPQLRR